MDRVCFVFLFSEYPTKGLQCSQWPEKIFKLGVTVSTLSVALLTDIVKLESLTPRKKQIASW